MSFRNGFNFDFSLNIPLQCIERKKTSGTETGRYHIIYLLLPLITVIHSQIGYNPVQARVMFQGGYAVNNLFIKGQADGPR
jgi:hypothetical protein